jgi:hypothetical protein
LLRFPSAWFVTVTSHVIQHELRTSGGLDINLRGAADRFSMSPPARWEPAKVLLPAYQTVRERNRCMTLLAVRSTPSCKVVSGLRDTHPMLLCGIDLWASGGRSSVAAGTCSPAGRIGNFTVWPLVRTSQATWTIIVQILVVSLQQHIC